MNSFLHFSLVIALSAFALTAHAQPKAAVDWPAIKNELESIFTTDQAMRLEFNSMLATTRAKGADVDNAASAQLWKRIGEQDLINQKRVIGIIDAYGWPKKSDIGPQAANAVFLVIQHAALDVQLEYVERMREAAMTGEASKQNLALLEDRLLVRQGKPQRYGSQVETRNGVDLKLTEDETNLDARRASMDLGPICVYLERFTKAHGKITYPPCLQEISNAK